jgi:hypothetical protein
MINSRSCRVFIYNMADSNTNRLCNDCKYRVAEIFQVNGDYCLQCWQEKTYPDVQNKILYDRMR